MSDSSENPLVKVGVPKNPRLAEFTRKAVDAGVQALRRVAREKAAEKAAREHAHTPRDK